MRVILRPSAFRSAVCPIARSDQSLASRLWRESAPKGAWKYCLGLAERAIGMVVEEKFFAGPFVEHDLLVGVTVGIGDDRVLADPELAEWLVLEGVGLEHV